MKKILLLNPPSKKILQRDFICSSSSKADYYWPPIDLVVLSGILKDYEVNVLDAIVDKKNITNILKLIKHKQIDFVISLVSSIDFENELILLNEIKKVNSKIKIIVTGDIAFFEKERIIKNKSIDAILLDFTSKEIIKYIENPKNKNIHNLIYKLNKKIIFNKSKIKKTFSYNQANLDLFHLDKYSVPYAIHAPLAPILTNYGCPYNCSFCSSGRIGYKLREIEEVKREISNFEKKGFKEIFIRDFNFTTNRKFVEEFCKFMIKNKINLIWSCEGRVDNVDEKLLALMKRAGCYLIFFGVEVGSQKKIDKFQKQITLKQIERIFKFCKKIKIKTLASFILALPGDKREDILRTINFSKKIKPDYASFNLYVPRYGSILRENLIKNKSIKNDTKFDSSTEFNNFTNMPDNEIEKLFRYANKSFYFRPDYILKKLIEIKTISQFKNHLSNGLKLLKNNLI